MIFPSARRHLLLGGLLFLWQFLNAQTPNLSISTPFNGLIGEEVCFPVTLSNTGPAGFGPYVRLILPPGYSLNSATLGGTAQPIANLGVIGAAAPNNYVLDPLLVANGTPEAADTIFATIGSTVILVQFLEGANLQGGILLESEFCLTVSSITTLGVPDNICAQTVYQYGDTPNGANGPILGSIECGQITPIDYTFEKTGPWITLPGACHSYTYTMSVDIGAGATLNGPLVFNDNLPADLQYAGNLIMPAGCVATTTPSLVVPGGTLTVTCAGSYTGGAGPGDMVVTFDAYASDYLDETFCDYGFMNNDATFDVPGNFIQNSVVFTDVTPLRFTHTNNTTGTVTIGQVVQYNLDFSLTQFSAGVNRCEIFFSVCDGMLFDPASVLWGGLPVNPANVIVTPSFGTGVDVTVDVFAENGGNILPCVAPTLQYSATVLETYGGSGLNVIARDLLFHPSVISYDLAEGALFCSLEASSSVEVVDVSFQKTVVNAPTHPNGLWWPGDVITYRLALSIPSKDLNDVIITDFFPFPVHDVTTLAAAFGTDVRFDPASCWTTPPIGYVLDASTNSLELSFGDISDAGSGACVDVILLIDIAVTAIPFSDGLAHANFMQVNSDNSWSDNSTSNVLVTVPVGAPNLSMTKGVLATDNPNTSLNPITSPVNANAVGVDANDNLTFQLTIENMGGAPGFDVQIRDLVPVELTGCALVAVNPVTDGANNPIPFVGGFAGNSLTLDMTNPIDFSGVGTGADVIKVSYVCQAAPNLPIGLNFNNMAEVDWASGVGAMSFLPKKDSAILRVSNPSMTKTVRQIFPGYAGNLTQTHIGEVIRYALEIIVPEGEMQNVRLNDLLDEGLAFVSVDSIRSFNSSGAANLTTSVAGGFNAVASAATINAIGAGPEEQDRELILDFATIQNLDNDNIDDTLRIYYSTIVINHLTNQDGDALQNSATFSRTNPNNPTARQSVTVQAAAVNIIEARVLVSKVFSATQVLPGGNTFVTIEVSNPATSIADAFDVSLRDVLPAGMSFVSGFTTGGTANITTAPNQAAGTITAHWDTIRVGQNYTLTFEVQASSTISPCYTLTNCANVVWESIAEANEASMPTAFSSPLGVKRTGNVANPGGVANDYTRDSCANVDVIIDSSFDPVISSNAPVCVGQSLTLSVSASAFAGAQYHWFGPGVPVAFNSNTLVINPVSYADTGTYYMYIELSGCFTDTAFYVVTLNPTPAAPNIMPLNSTVCEGSTVSFYTDTLANAYTWTGPNGFTGSTATPAAINPVTPADAGTYSLFVTNVQGCNSSTVQSTLTVTPSAAGPFMTTNSPICSGDTLFLSSTSSAASYQWTAPNGNSVITATGQLTLPSTDTLYLGGNWTLTLINPSVCYSSSSVNSNVVINPKPATPIVSNNGPICEGTDAILLSSTLAGATYAWYSDVALTTLVATGNNPTITGLTSAASPHIFYAQIRSSAGCFSDTASTVVVVNPQPAAPAPTYNFVCEADTLFLFANVLTAGYNWSGPSGFSSSLENPFIANATAVNAGSYSLTITNASGCSSSASVLVNITARPITPSVNSNSPVCVGNAITLTTQLYAGTVVNYNWTTPTGSVVTAGPSLTVSAATMADSGLYSVVVHVDGCNSLPGSTNVIVSPNPARPVASSNSPVCEGANIVLSTLTAAATYSWTGPNGYTGSGATPPAIVASATTAGNYILQVQNAMGCPSPFDTVLVTVNSLPSTPDISNNSPICSNSNLVLSTTSPGSFYIWYAPNGADTTTSVNNLNVNPSNSFYQSGNWTLQVVNAASCTSSVSVQSSVTINSTPAQPLVNNNGSICSGASAVLSTPVLAGATYAWYSDAALTNLVSTAQNPTVTNITSDSSFYLVVTQNGCASPAATTTVLLHPATPKPNVPADFLICEGGIISLSTSTVASGYSWSGPNGFSSNLQNPPSINPATLADGGTYTLSILDANGCRSADTSVVVTVSPATASPTMTSNSPICAGTNLVLSTNALANFYIWTAPNGVDTTTLINNLIVTPSSGFYQAGIWNLQTQNIGACISNLSPDHNVIINPIPAAPATSNSGPVCIGSSVTLSTPLVAGGTYAWYADATRLVLVSTAATAVVNNITSDSTFYLVLTVNGCASPMSSTLVQVVPRPATPNLPANFTVCEGDPIALSTSTVASAYFWSGPNGFSSNQQNPAVVFATMADSGMYYLSVANAAGCRSLDSTVLVTVRRKPNSPISSNNSPLCEGQTLVLSASSGLAGTTYEWFYLTSGASVGFGQNLSIPAITTAQAGDYYVVASLNGCSSFPSALTNVQVSTVPSTTAFAGVDQALCNVFNTNMAATPPAASTGTWSSPSGASIANPNDPNSTVFNLSLGVNTFIWSLSDGPCVDFSRDTVLVSVTPSSADIAFAGVDRSYCERDSIDLNATVPTQSSGVWSQTSAQASMGSTILNPSAPNSPINGLIPGNTYTYIWTLSFGNCIDYSSDTVIIRIDNIPNDNAFAGFDENICDRTATNFAALASSFGVGLWSHSSSATVIDPNIPNSLVVDLPLGPTYFFWTLSNGACINYSTDTVVITYTNTPDTAYAGPDQAICEGQDVYLNAQPVTVGYGTWVQSAAQTTAGVVIVDVNNPNSQVFGTIAGNSYQFTWVLSNGACTNYSSDEVTISISTSPVDNANAGTDINLCGSNSTNLNALAPLVATGVWTTTSSASITNPNSPNASISNLPIGTSVFVWTLSSGSCVDYSIDSMQVVVTQPSGDVAFAGTDTSYCAENSINLLANTPSVGNGVWSQTLAQAGTGVVITTPSNPATTVTGLQAGSTYIFTWSLSNGGCLNYSTDSIIITIDDIPAISANAGTDIIVCNDTIASLNAATPAQGTGQWACSTAGVVIVDPAVSNSLVTNLPSGTTEFYWSLSNGSCRNYSTDTVLIITNPASNEPADAGADVFVCEVDSAQIDAAIPAVSTGVWSQSSAQANLGVVILSPNNPSSLVQGLVAGNSYEFYWTLSNGNCVDYDTDTVLVVVNEIPADIAFAGFDMVFCSNAALVLQATSPSIGAGAWTTTSTANIVTPNQATTDVFNLSLGSNEFIWTLSNGACLDYSSDTIVISMGEVPVANNDTITLVYNAVTAPASVVINDNLPSSWDIFLLGQPSQGSVTNLGDGTFGMNMQNVLTTQQFQYSICNPACPSIFCDTALVTLIIRGDVNCKVPNIFTPNGDGVNDEFFIPCLDNYPNNRLIVFNRWGDIVYETENYLNTWEGTFNGNPLPDGTYFYIMKVDNNTELQGFVELRR